MDGRTDSSETSSFSYNILAFRGVQQVAKKSRMVQPVLSFQVSNLLDAFSSLRTLQSLLHNDHLLCIGTLID